MIYILVHGNYNNDKIDDQKGVCFLNAKVF